MARTAEPDTTYAVVDAAHHIVVLLQGADAWDSAQDWVARGYHVEPLADDSDAFRYAGAASDVA